MRKVKCTSPDETKRRYYLVANAVVNGKTYKDAGSLIGVGAERARQITARVMATLRNQHFRKHGVELKNKGRKEITTNKLKIIECLDMYYNPDSQFSNKQRQN